jgi:uncharacterized membrane protein
MISYALPRVLHVLAIVLWIGGVSFVTTILLPAIRRMPSDQDKLALFERIEGAFAWQARVTTVVAGATGFYMVHKMSAWHWFADPQRWYLHAMVAVWVLFTLMLFVLEPLVLHRLFHKWARKDADGTLRFVHRMHWVLLLVSLLTVAGAVAGAHGWLWL